MGVGNALRSIKRQRFNCSKNSAQPIQLEINDLPKESVNGFSYPIQNTRID